jgi:hypothetical protein
MHVFSSKNVLLTESKAFTEKYWPENCLQTEPVGEVGTKRPRTDIFAVKIEQARFKKFIIWHL